MPSNSYRKTNVCIRKLTVVGMCSGTCFFNNIWLMLWEIIDLKKRSLAIKCLYTKKFKRKYFLLVLYVLFNVRNMLKCKKKIYTDHFPISDLYVKRQCICETILFSQEVPAVHLFKQDVFNSVLH